MAKRTRKSRRSVIARRSAVGGPVHTPQAPTHNSARETIALQSAFWQHMVREMLTALSVLEESQPKLFDGRMAVLTQGGERIAIASIQPLFACGIPGTPAEKALSIAVECTVFRIRTPEGEVFTLPVSEVRAMHSLSDDLVKTLEASVEQGEGSEPFGFAAYTSLARQEGTGRATGKNKGRKKRPGKDGTG